jgi:hypothetical protein
MNPYLDDLEGVYTPWTLLFLEKRRIEKPCVFSSINEGQISLTYINETINMVGTLRDLVYTYKYREIIISIRMIILDEDVWKFIIPSIILF